MRFGNDGIEVVVVRERVGGCPTHASRDNSSSVVAWRKVDVEEQESLATTSLAFLSILERMTLDCSVFVYSLYCKLDQNLTSSRQTATQSRPNDLGGKVQSRSELVADSERAADAPCR
jgi:hypothetical protein